MAEKEDLDLDLSEDEAGSKGKSKLLILVILGVILLGGGVGSFFLLKGDPGDGGEKEVEGEVEQGPMDANTLYFRIPNAIVVNIAGGKRGRILQVKVAFQIKSSDAEVAVKDNLPLLTNKLLTRFSTINADELTTKEQKIALKAECLELLRKTLEERTGSPHIEKLLFTSLVMQ